MKPTYIFLVSTLGMLLAVGCTKAETPEVAADKPVAVVNGSPISRDVWNLYVKTRHAGKTPGDLTAEEQNEALEELIGMYAGSQEADKQKLGEGEPRARLELVGKSAMAELLYKKFTEGAEPTEEELKAEYDARIAEAPKEEFHARHILVDDEAKAKELIAKLDGGASFEQLAKDNSKDSSAAEGGDLGWFNPNQMVKPFSDAVQQLEVGRYTAVPVQSEFGWHVIKLDDVRALKVPSFDEVKPQLQQRLQQQALKKAVDDLRAKAKIE